MIRNWLFGLLLIFLIIVLIFGIKPQKSPIDWSPNYNPLSKSPFGTFIVYNSLKSLFPGADVQSQDLPIYNILKNNNKTGNLVIIIHSQGYNFNSGISSTDLEQMIRFAKLGNSILIVSNSLEKTFQKNLGLKLDYSLIGSGKKESKFRLSDTSFWGNKFYSMDISHVLFERSILLNKKNNAVILGLDGKNKPNYVKYPLSKGAILFHSAPEFLSNYFVLKDNNFEYINSALGYINTPINHIIWDMYYLHDHKELSPLEFVFFQPNLRIGAFCIILLFLLFVTIQIKRRQRIIPIILPIQNKTLEFTQTLGLLYFEKRDNKNLFEKMAAQFSEFMKNRYYIFPKDFSEENLVLIVSKTGLKEAEIKEMIHDLQNLKAKTVISDSEILSFNEQLQKFYK